MSGLKRFLIVLSVTFVTACMVGMLGNVFRRQPTARVLQSHITTEGMYSLEVEFRDIPHGKVYGRSVLISPSEEGDAKATEGAVDYDVTDGTRKVSFSFDVSQFPHQAENLRFQVDSVIVFKDGEREIQVFSGENEAGETFEAFVGIGPKGGHGPESPR